MSIDLHSHSTASDGSLSPTQLVMAAKAAGVDTLALTDHDTVAGLKEAARAAKRAGLRLINGVEISVRWEKRTLHIVGLGINPENPQLAAGLADLQQQRLLRAEKIASKLEKIGLANAGVRALKAANGGQVTRTHFARLLVEDGLCKDQKQAFKRFLGSGKPGHVSMQWTTLENAIEWIHRAGGLAILAHPLLYPQSAAWRRRMVAAFKQAGGDGLEICCGHSNAEQIQTSTRDALAHNLLGSVGSDFHAPEQRWLKLGRLTPLPSSLTPVWQRLSMPA